MGNKTVRSPITINIKSTYVQDLFDNYSKTLSFSEKENLSFFENASPQIAGESIIFGYATDMIGRGEIGRDLNLTYETVSNISHAINPLFRQYQKSGMWENDPEGSLARALAAYLIVLAMNEHDCPLKVTQMGSKLFPPPEDEYPLWGGILRIKTGRRREIDFLPSIVEGMKKTSLKGKTLLTITVNPVIRAYRSAVGTDLSQYELKDFIIEL